MIDEAKGNLEDTSLNEQGKRKLLDLSVTATQDVTKKKDKTGKSKKTTVELGEIDGIKYRIQAIKQLEKGSQTESIIDNIRKIELSPEIKESLILKYKDGKINNNNIRVISKINIAEEVSHLNPSTQEKVIDAIINNRNQQNQINSEEAATHVLKSGKINQFIVDNWYNGMLRLINKLRIQSDVNEDVLLELSPERNMHLSEKLKNLIQVLRQLLLLLEKSRT